MATGVARKPQENLPGLGAEKELDDGKLERQLLERERARKARGEANKTFKEIDDAVKARITELKIKGSAHIAGFVITVKEIKGHKVAFETKPSKRIYITPPKEEE